MNGKITKSIEAQEKEQLRVREDAEKAGICSIDAEFGYTVSEAREALPHVQNFLEKHKAGYLQILESDKTHVARSR